MIKKFSFVFLPETHIFWITPKQANNHNKKVGLFGVNCKLNNVTPTKNP